MNTTYHRLSNSMGVVRKKKKISSIHIRRIDFPKTNEGLSSCAKLCNVMNVIRISGSSTRVQFDEPGLANS